MNGLRLLVATRLATERGPVEINKVLLKRDSWKYIEHIEQFNLMQTQPNTGYNSLIILFSIIAGYVFHSASANISTRSASWNIYREYITMTS